VRATVLDAFSLNYRIALAEKAASDRSQASHAINLCGHERQIRRRGEDSEVLTFLDSLPSDMFDLPKGSSAPAPRPRLAANILSNNRVVGHSGAPAFFLS